MFEDYVQPIVDFARAHEAWAAPIVFALAFMESLAFISLLVPAWGALVLIGTVIQLLLPLPWLRRTGFKIARSFDWRDERVIRVLKLMFIEPVNISP